MPVSRYTKLTGVADLLARMEVPQTSAGQFKEVGGNYCLQVVWPDRSRRFSWEPGFYPEFQEDRRLESDLPRTGGGQHYLAVQTRY